MIEDVVEGGVFRDLDLAERRSRAEADILERAEGGLVGAGHGNQLVRRAAVIGAGRQDADQAVLDGQGQAAPGRGDGGACDPLIGEVAPGLAVTRMSGLRAEPRRVDLVQLDLLVAGTEAEIRRDRKAEAEVVEHVAEPAVLLQVAAGTLGGVLGRQLDAVHVVERIVAFRLEPQPVAEPVAGGGEGAPARIEGVVARCGAEPRRPDLHVLQEVDAAAQLDIRTRDRLRISDRRTGGGRQAEQEKRLRHDLDPIAYRSR